MRRVHSILAVSVLLFGMLLLFGCQSKELTSAKVYIQQDDWQKAEEQLKMAVELYPADAEAHRWLGEAYGRTGDFENMNKEFDASLANSPQFADDINSLRTTYWVQNFNQGISKVKAADQAENETEKSKRLVEALDLFQVCPVIDPERTDAYKNIAFVYIRLDSVDGAIENYEKVVAVDQSDTKTMLQLGSLYYEKKDYQKCVDLMDKILAVESGNLDALSQKAFAFDSMGDSDKAFASYEEALSKNPGDPDLLFNMGRLYYMKKNYETAIEQFKKVLEVVPDDLEATLNIGNAYLSIAERFMKPIRDGKELTADEIDDAKNNAIENYKESIPYLEKATQLRADDAALWTNLGVAYINAGMKDKGEEAFKKAEELE